MLNKKYISFLDNILKQNFNLDFILALSSLHFRRSAAYKEIFFYSNKSRKNLFINWLKKIFLDKKNFFLRKNINNKAQICIVSYFTDNNIKNFRYSKDLYFGSFINELKKDFSLETLYHNSSNYSSKYINFKLRQKINILSNNSGLFFELKSIILSLFAYAYLNLRYKSNLTYTSTFALKKIFSIITNLRINNQILLFIEKINPRVIIIPHEGHAWENLVLKNIRKKYPKKIILSYQFSNIFRDSHAIFRKINNNYMADKILTTSNLSSKIFKKKGIKNVLTIGSPKYKKSNKIKYKNNFNVLVLPEGVKSEHVELYNLIKELTKQYPKYNFYFKIHPSFIKILKKKFSKSSNIILCNDKIKIDQYYNICSFVIFKGTSLALDAIKNGLLPIFIKKDKYSHEPFWIKIPKKHTLENTNDFKKISKVKKIDSKILGYANNFYEKIDIKDLEKYFKSKNV